MTPLLLAAATALHALATIVFIGHYLLLSLLYLPVLATADTGRWAALSEVSKRSRSWLYVSLLVFFLTGFYLMLVDANYQGIGNFGSPWAVLMLVKHLVVLVMIGIGFYFNAVVRVGPALRTRPGDAQTMARFHSYVNMMSVSGVLVIVLTALAQFA